MEGITQMMILINFNFLVVKLVNLNLKEKTAFYCDVEIIINGQTEACPDRHLGHA